MHNYTKENWIKYHGYSHQEENWEQEWQKWLTWRLSVDRGETRCNTMIIYRGEMAYESPITGKAITSMAQRREDMARAGCVEYDPEMKTDYTRRMAREEAELESKFDSSIDQAIATLPVKSRENLARC